MGRYRYDLKPVPPANESHGVAYWTPGDGRVIAIADGVVLHIGETDPKRVGVGVMISHPSVGKWAYYDYLAEVRVRQWDTVRRGDIIGWAVRPGHVRGVAPSNQGWLPRMSLEICDPPCEAAHDDPTPYLDSCLRLAKPRDVVYPVWC